MPLQGIPSLFGGGRGTAAAAFSAGFDFRSTAGYVTDPAGYTYDRGENYPTTRNGVTFGWDGTGGIDSRDRSTSIPKLAGIVFCSNLGTLYTWRLDLPATGTYNISLALGDGQSGNAQTNYFELLDNVTSKILFNPIATGANDFADAAGNLWSPANWITSNVSVPVTFSSTTLFIKMGGTIHGGDSSCIANLLIAA